MNLSEEASKRIDAIRFPLIVGVIFIHAFDTEVGFAGGSVGIANASAVVDFVRNLISQGLARTAVPIFFLLAGYFFFYRFEWSIQGFVGKLRSRVRTLLVTFIFWNILVLAMLAALQSMPVTQQYFSGKNQPIAEYGYFDYTNAILGLTKPPIAYQFWFIRDLIVLVILTPVVAIALRRVPLYFTGLIAGCWLFNIWPVYVPAAQALLFFSVGAWVAVANKSLFQLDRYGPVLLSVYLPVLVLDALTKNWLYSPVLHRGGVVLGVIAVLYITKMVIYREGLKNRLVLLSGASFFVFAVHEPLLMVLRKIVFKAFHPSTNLAVLSAYLLIPGAVVCIALVARHFIEKAAPRFLAVVSGGR